MTVERKTASQFLADLRAAALAQSSDYDVTVGPVPDAMLIPHAAVLEAQNERLRKVSLVQSVANEVEFDDTEFTADADALVDNEGMLRSPGARSTATETFHVARRPATDAVVPRGYPMGTAPDAATGSTVVFVASETKTLAAASADSYYNASEQRYELDVPYVAVAAGRAGQVAADRITRKLRPLVGFDGATNPAASAGGRDAELNRELFARYRLAVVGQQLATPLGVLRDARGTYPDIRDLLAVYGNDALLTRAGTDAGAVDAYVIGEQLLQTAEGLVFPGVGQLMAVGSPPLRTVLSVVSGATTYVEGDDYDVVYDTSGYGGSTRASEGVRFRTGGTNALPAVGATVTVTYSYNALIRTAQAAAAGEDKQVFGRDLLYRQGTAVPLVITGTLRVGAGFNALTVQAAVRERVLEFIGGTTDAMLQADPLRQRRLGLGLGARHLDDPTEAPGYVEVSDLQGDVRLLTGVDNFTLTVLRRSTGVAGVVTDLAIARNEYPTLTDADLSVPLA